MIRARLILWATATVCLMTIGWAAANPTIEKTYTTDGPEPLGLGDVVHYEIEVDGMSPGDGTYWFWDVVDEGLSVPLETIVPIPYAYELGLDGRMYILWNGYSGGGAQPVSKSFHYDAVVWKSPASELLCNRASVYLQSDSTSVEVDHEHTPLTGGAGDANRDRDARPTRPAGAHFATRIDDGDPPEPVDPTDPPGRRLATTPDICVQAVTQPSITKTISAPERDYQRVGQTVTYTLNLKDLVPGTDADPNPYVLIEELDTALVFESITATDPGLAAALTDWPMAVTVDDGRWVLAVEFVATLPSSWVTIVARVATVPPDGWGCNAAEIVNPFESASGRQGAGESQFSDSDNACLRLAESITISKEIAGYSPVGTVPYGGTDPGDYTVVEGMTYNGDYFDRALFYTDPIVVSDDTFTGFNMRYSITLMEGDSVADLSGTNERYQILDYSPFPHCFKTGFGECNDAVLQPVRNFLAFFPDGASRWAHNFDTDHHWLIVDSETPVDAYDGDNPTPEGEQMSWNVILPVPRDYVMEGMGIVHNALSGISLGDLGDAQFTVESGTVIQLCNVVAVWDMDDVDAAGSAAAAEPLHRELVCVPVQCQGTCTHSLADWQYDAGRIIWALMSSAVVAGIDLNGLEILLDVLDVLDALGLLPEQSAANDPNNPADCPWHKPECYELDELEEPEACFGELPTFDGPNTPSSGTPAGPPLSRATVMVMVPIESAFPTFSEAEPTNAVTVGTGDVILDAHLEAVFDAGDWRSSVVFDRHMDPGSLSLGDDSYFVTLSASARDAFMPLCASSPVVECEDVSGMVVELDFDDSYASQQHELTDVFASEAWDIIEIYEDALGCQVPESTVGVIEPKFMDPHIDQAAYLNGVDAGQIAVSTGPIGTPSVVTVPQTSLVDPIDPKYARYSGWYGLHAARVSGVLNFVTNNAQRFASLTRNTALRSVVKVYPIELEGREQHVHVFQPKFDTLSNANVVDIVINPDTINQESLFVTNNGPYCLMDTPATPCDVQASIDAIILDTNGAIGGGLTYGAEQKMTFYTTPGIMTPQSFRMELEGEPGQWPDDWTEGSHLRQELSPFLDAGPALYSAIRVAILEELPVLSMSVKLRPLKSGPRTRLHTLLDQYDDVGGRLFKSAGNWQKGVKPCPVPTQAFNMDHPVVTAIAGTKAGDLTLHPDSCRGPEVDLSAPFSVLSFAPTNTGAGGPKTVSGTSFSTPMVAGAYAVVSAMGGSWLDIKATADGVSTEGSGHGRLNFCKAVERVALDELLKAFELTDPSETARRTELGDAMDAVGVIGDGCVP